MPFDPITAALVVAPSADPTGSPWLAVLGRTHPLVLHLPLGALPCVFLLEFGALFLRREVPRGAVTALAAFAAVGAVLAAATGLVLAGETGAEGGATLGRHKIAGIVMALLCVAAAALSLRGNRKPFRIALLAACVAMVPTGHLGGSLTHGSDFLFEPLQPRPPRAPAGSDGDPAATGSPPAAATEFARSIAPILERTCTKCHHEDKQKGELLLTTVEGIRKGGENGPVLVAGKPDESELLRRCLLPIDDDDHMPPEGKPQPTPEELATLRAWIAAGATFD
jgi:uncharacterized membrane protein